MSKELLSETDLCEWLGLSRGTIRAYRTQEYDPMPCLSTGSVYRYNPDQIMAWLERQAGKTMRIGSRYVSKSVIECAMAIATDSATAEQIYSSDVLELANDAFGSGGATLGEILRAATREVSHRDIRAMFHQIQAGSAGLSTNDISGILSNIANKLIIAAFNFVEQEWRKVCKITSCKDFKEHKTYSLLTDALKYELVGNGGEIKHGQLGEVAYTNKAETRAKMLGISRQDLINDDMRALNKATALGRGAGLSLNEVIWTTFLSQVGTFWSAANKNLLSGAVSALSLQSLTDAETLLITQTTPSGQPLGASAAILLTGPANRSLGGRLCNDATMAIAGTTDRTETTTNPFAGRLQPVSSAYLASPTIPGANPLSWWLLSDPRDICVIEAMFLDGVVEPKIESADLDTSVLGVSLRGYADFGIAMHEFRGSVRSVGA